MDLDAVSAETADEVWQLISSCFHRYNDVAPISGTTYPSVIIADVAAIQAMTECSIVMSELSLARLEVIERVASALEEIRAEGDESITSIGVRRQHTYRLPTKRKELVASWASGTFDDFKERCSAMLFFGTYVILGRSPRLHFIYSDHIDQISVVGGPRKFIDVLCDGDPSGEAAFVEAKLLDDIDSLPPFFALNNWIRQTHRPIASKYPWEAGREDASPG
jgi:hypothetical protein